MGVSLFPPAVRVLKDLLSYFAAFVSVSSFCGHVLIFWTASLTLIHLALTNMHWAHKDAVMLAFHVGLSTQTPFISSFDIDTKAETLAI